MNGLLNFFRCDDCALNESMCVEFLDHYEFTTVIENGVVIGCGANPNNIQYKD